VHNAPVIIHLRLFAQESEVLLLQQQVEAFFHARFVRKGQVPTSWLMDFLRHETKEGDKLRLWFLDLCYIHLVDFEDSSFLFMRQGKIHAGERSWFHEFHLLARKKMVFIPTQEQLDRRFDAFRDEKPFQAFYPLHDYLRVVRKAERTTPREIWQFWREQQEQQNKVSAWAKQRHLSGDRQSTHLKKTRFAEHTRYMRQLLQ
jgi:hypothetical protein